jgi:drug/metabolite transporter (DMT)-like permease
MLAAGRMSPVRSSGSLLILLSAAAFGAMAVFGKLAYEQGATVGTTLSARFILAALVSWAVLLASRTGLAALRSLRRRDLAIAIALGACGYAAQAGSYFAALEHIDASLLALILYTYPAVVAVAAVALGRERLDTRQVVALVLALVGLALVVGGAGTGALDPLGVTLAVVAALIYTAYILASEPVSGRVAPQVLSTVVCTGAAVTLTAGSAALGELHPAAVSAAGWGWLAALAIVSTVIAIALFFAGLRRVGPTSAGILSTTEPLVTVGLAMLVFGEVLGPAQVLGGALVLSGVLVLHVRIARPAPATAT